MIQTIISRKSFIDTVDLLRKEYNKLSDNGTFFVMFSTEYNEQGNVQHDFLEIISVAINIGYTYVNTIVYPTNDKQAVTFVDNVRYVVWLCKDRCKMTFEKDAIREKHIWKDVEWGKRAKNYNPKGKDPGNVWIPTVDDGNAHITDHIMLSDEKVIIRLLKMSKCGENYATYLDKLPLRSVSLEQHQKAATHNGNKPFGKVVFDTSEEMTAVRDSSVDVVVTSPPYWNLKDYFKEGQIGQEPYERYLFRMRKVWTECYKKLKPHGSLWININIRVHENQVILIPFDFVKICKEVGFSYKGILIWHKSSGIPTSNHNIVDRHEYILVFAKSDNCYVNPETIKAFGDYKNSKINGGAFWNINRKAGSVGKKYIHPAIYPNELVSRIVLATTQYNGLVLDPFLGSGTSLIAALQIGRSFIGYEYNEGFKELMQSRFSRELDTDNYEFIYT